MTTLKSLHRSGSVLLSPQKRRRISGQGNSSQAKTPPSSKQVWEWILTSATVVKCYVRDAIAMSQDEEGWSFPEASAEIVGIVVGIQAYEKKIIYSVDDGTSVIDCTHAFQQPKKRLEGDKSSLPIEPPKPIARIGGVVDVVGRVRPQHGIRVIVADAVVPSSFERQLNHWKSVRNLHKTCYSCTEPFVIPVASIPSVPETPRKVPGPAKEDCTSPSVASQTTTATSPVAISPVKSKFEPQSPTKLRHPSRLRSYNLTDAAFRLYIKHYINNAPQGPTASDSDSDDNIYMPIRQYTSHILDTTICKQDYKILTSTPKTRSSASTSEGFTLSYLRRVPELSLMAKRVVKQRAREEKKLRETTSQSTSKSSSKRPVKHVKLDRAGLASKKKRLFQWAICELLRDGSIVLWDGPKRSYSGETSRVHGDASVLWKDSSTMTATNESLFSSTDISKLSSVADESESELSEPDPEEEAYMPTKPEILAAPIKNALVELALVPKRQMARRTELMGGSSKEEILGHLRRDDRWHFIGEWNITETLEYMDEEHMAWCIGNDKWIATQ
ncbi:hypothetical protein AGABI1DRAFT_130465 [Agaricus bisporus var. burnettii JB137-S8]|uniref:CST complex subunit STN1 n=1 Tax=Agaricus bisporus var. burnettii (strain JB137-S8 / ATCC MYA-4627 / FGSC 10392) TaxID=597362 RepID=K5X375_AGABU|nr:uncharacterized protein AGABI1DRAFT_130465 [Agaricus bisporus var. burnettii JB137-S8]EKM77382.1 hypothetical protein AGABI1DRAFT_130465 [Agaricus bisporus var. burnettii JB137-S8]